MYHGVVLDTGPLVAFLNGRDTWHDWAVARWKEVEPPFQTCEAVLAEAAYLLRADARGPDALMALLSREVLVCDFRLADEAEHIQRLLNRYRDVPMSLADACLVRMTELQQRATVLTLDSDFRRYRRLGRQVVPVISPKA